ncbi:nucleoside-diphosphate kinase [Candidatus Pacearchaeota archaeon]|nr:nucleoside-diphosphate kinase [Candidatus Pacearchaeota archaeon]
MVNERTLVLIKPDGVKKHLIGEVIKRFESRGLKIVALKMSWPTKIQMDIHYPKDKEWIAGLGNNTIKSYKEFNNPTTVKEDFGTENPYEIGLKVREWLIDFMTSGPIVKIVVEGLNAIKMVRKIVGQTIPAFAEPGTIRGDFSIDSPDLANMKKRAVKNLIHASGNPQEAEHEISHWFSPEEIHEYETIHDLF